MSKTKKFFVTGGSGFIGRHVIRELVDRGHDVISCDVVPPLEKIEGVDYQRGSIMDRTNMAQRMRGCDAVLHLAAVIGVKKATVELLNCLNVNIGGTISVLEAALMAGVSEVLVTSSSEVFGDSEEGAYHETSSFNPKSAYAVSKLACEEYALAYAREFGIKHRVVRYFNVYGRGQSPDFVMSIFSRNVAENEPLRVYGDGSQVRAFCHVRDAARTTVEAAVREETAGHTFNIGNDREPISMRELAERFVRIGDLDPDRVQLIDFDQSDRTSSREIYRRVPDVTKAVEMLGHAPSVDLDTGIEEVIRTARENLDSAGSV